MSGNKPRYTVMRYWVQLSDERELLVEVWPVDIMRWEDTAPRHGWTPQEEYKAHGTTFLCWSAARRAGQIESDVKFERFAEQIVALAEDEPQEVDPTEPAPGAG